jgi:hypothetical protein
MTNSLSYGFTAIDMMMSLRCIAHSRVDKALENRIAEVLVGIGMARTGPIGYDRNQNLYWILTCSSNLFVSTLIDPPKSVTVKSEMLGRNLDQNLNEDSELYRKFLQSSLSYLPTITVKELPDSIADIPFNNNITYTDMKPTVIWMKFTETNEIQTIINNLNTNYYNEKQLKQILQILYPNLVRHDEDNNDRIRVMLTTKRDYLDSIIQSIPHVNEVKSDVMVTTDDTCLQAPMEIGQTVIVDTKNSSGNSTVIPPSHLYSNRLSHYLHEAQQCNMAD